jgi:hypothetical protein
METKEKEGINFVYHTFGSGETIRAIIRKYNHNDMSEDMLVKFTERYNEINGGGVPHLGQQVKIPLFLGFVGMKQHKRGYEND